MEILALLECGHFYAVSPTMHRYSRTPVMSTSVISTTRVMSTMSAYRIHSYLIKTSLLSTTSVMSTKSCWRKSWHNRGLSVLSENKVCKWHVTAKVISKSAILCQICQVWMFWGSGPRIYFYYTRNLESYIFWVSFSHAYPLKQQQPLPLQLGLSFNREIR